jgi:hypothetical protein
VVGAFLADGDVLLGNPEHRPGSDTLVEEGSGHHGPSGLDLEALARDHGRAVEIAPRDAGQAGQLPAVRERGFDGLVADAYNWRPCYCWRLAMSVMIAPTGIRL